MTNLARTVSAILGVLMALTMFASSVSAAPPDPKGRQLNASQCNTGNSPLINVTFDVVNDADSGVAGNAWAMDSYTKHIQVWAQGDGTFCAIVKYAGQFVTLAGPSPSGEGTLAVGIQGTFNGGYLATFNGTFAPGQMITDGNLGTFNYQCDPINNPTSPYACKGFDWLSTYFPGYTNFAQPYWAWTYYTGNNGSWVNASTSNSGDITGTP